MILFQSKYTEGIQTLKVNNNNLRLDSDNPKVEPTTQWK
jgi:hypothetical protein